MRLTIASSTLIIAAQAAWLAPVAYASTPDQQLSIGTNFLLEDNEVIVGLSFRKNTTLSDGMIAYAVGDDIALPFEQLMLLIEFPIKQDNATNTVTGWFISESRRFSLDVNNGVAQSAGKQYSFDKQKLLRVEGELFVPTKLLAQWFPLNFETSLLALNINIAPKEPLAIDQRTARKKKRFGTTYYNRSTYPEVDTPYQLLALPHVEINLSAGNHTNGDLSSAYTLRAKGDAAYMASSLYLSGSNNGVSNGRVLLSRKDPRGGLLGGLDATEINLGDISTRSLPLVATATSGRGFNISRRASGYADNQETIKLEGAIESNYDVELYRNDILIDAQLSTGATTYNFEDINLVSGDNVFRLEFYGPQGQRRTEIKYYNTSSGRVKKGQLYFDVGVSQPNKTVLDLDNDSLLDEYQNDAISASATFDYGLTSNLSIHGGLARQPDENSDEVRTYAVAGLTSQLGNFPVKLNSAVDDENGYAFSIGASTKLKNIDFSAKHESFFNDFVSNRSFDDVSEKQVKHRTSFDIRSSSHKLIKDAIIGVGLGASRSELDDGNTSYSLDTYFSAQRRSLSLTTRLDYDYQDTSDLEQLTGNTSLNYRSSIAHVRLSTSYDIQPESELSEGQVNISRRFSNQYTASLNLSKSFASDTESLSASISKDFGRYELGLTASHTKDDQGDSSSSLFLNLSFGLFGYNKNGGRTLLANRHHSGHANALAFFDENQDGIFNDNENAIPNVKFFGGRNKGTTANQYGNAIISGLNNGAWTDISLDPNSLPEPSWKASKPGVAVLTRPGVMSKIQLPVIATADIEGIVSLSRGTEATPLGNIGIDVLRMNKKTGKYEMLQQTTTAFDGLYVLTEIPVGDVVVRINPEQGKRLSVSGQLSKKIRLETNTDLLEGQDFTLIRR